MICWWFCWHQEDPFNGALLHETDLYWANKNEFLKSKPFVDFFSITCVNNCITFQWHIMVNKVFWVSVTCSKWVKQQQCYKWLKPLALCKFFWDSGNHGSLSQHIKWVTFIFILLFIVKWSIWCWLPILQDSCREQCEVLVWSTANLFWTKWDLCTSNEDFFQQQQWHRW